MAYGPQSQRFATRTVDRAEIDVGLRQHMLRIYNLMAGGLAVSGIVAWAVSAVPGLTRIFYNVTPEGYLAGFSLLGFVAMLAPLGILLFAMFRARTMSAATLTGLYWAFVALQGVGLSVLLFVYTGESVIRAFLVTAAAFGALSLYGYTTQRSLSGFGSFLIMGLFGLLLAAVVNIFLASSTLDFVISAVGVLIFSGLIAYDTQRIKEEYVAGMDGEVASKTATFAALSLYINFINLFQFILHFLGNRE